MRETWVQISSLPLILDVAINKVITYLRHGFLIVKSENINKYHRGLSEDVNDKACIKFIAEALQMVDIQ